MSRAEALSGLQQVIEFIARHPAPPPKDGETHYGVFPDEASAERNIDQIVASMRAVGFPVVEGDDEREIWNASDLDADQRVVAELLAHHPELPSRRFPMPSPAWAKRKWLGIDPPGPLFKDKKSLFVKLREIGADEDDDWLPQIEALAVKDRIIALTELVLLRNDFDTDASQNALLDALAEMPDTLGDWGERTANMLLAVQGKPWESSECGVWGIEPIVVETVFYALVSAGLPFEPKHDRLLALANYAYEPSVPVLRTIVEAIPSERRERAIAEALSRLNGPTWHLAIAMRMLPTFPYPAIAQHALAHIEDGKPKKVLQELGVLAKKHPAIAEVLEAYKLGQTAGPKLTVLERNKPTLDDLDAIARKQVELCARRYDDRKETAAELIACDGDEPIGPFERTRIAEGGKLAYDAWRYMGDSGTVFRSGSTSVVAEIIQDGLECADRALKRSLLDALSSRSAKKLDPKSKPKSSSKAKRKAASTTTSKRRAATKTKAGAKTKPTATRKKSRR